MMHNPQTEELFHIAGDQPDPSGSNLRGTSIGTDFTKTAIAHPMIRWRSRVLEADVYAIDGQLLVHLICPKCKGGLHIRQAAKRMTLNGNQLSTERIACTFPGCDWRVTIDSNYAKDA